MTELPQTFVVDRAAPQATGARPAELAIVVPTFNEAQNVPLLVDALANTLRDISWEVIFVDDDSPDGTAGVVRRLAQINPRVRCLRRIGRRGLAGAAIEGILSTSADYVAVMDGDLQHDETLLPLMFDRIRSGADIVVASRFSGEGTASQGLSALRLRASETATGFARRLLGIEVRDPLSGFFVIRRELFDDVVPRLSTQGFKLLLDILASATRPFAAVEVGMRFRPRLNGTSKLDRLVALEYLSLLVAKVSHDWLSLRFISFAVVGAIGVGVHLAALHVLLATTLPFAPAQALAAYAAMTSNFFLNNTFTYRDRRLTGWRMIAGLMSFYALCSIGVFANVGAGQLVHQELSTWWVAGLAGALMGAVFNYAATSVFTWRRA